MRLLLPCLIGVLTNAAATQDVRWRLPEGGLVRYATSLVEQCHPRAAANRNAALPHGSLPHASLLLANELTESAKSTTVRLHDLRWLLPRLAFDLSTFGPARRFDRVFDDVVPFLPFRLQGTITAAGADGTQTMTLELSPAPIPKPKERDPRRAPASLGTFDSTAAGTLKLTRTVDVDAGIVRTFLGEIRLQIDHPPRYPEPQCDYTLRQAWRDPDVRTRRQAGFEAEVAEAIRRGAEHLQREFSKPSEGILRPDDQASHAEGYLALGLLTMLHAEVPTTDAVVLEGFRQLRRRNVRETYPLALALMAMERLHAPPREREDLLAGVLKAPAPRRLVGDDAEAMDRWTKALLDNRDTEVRADYLTRWRYSGPGYDNSNTQYGVLGLHSADLCERKIGRTTWFAVANHWLAEQCPAEGPAVPLTLQSIEPKGAAMAAGGAAKGRTTAGHGSGRTQANRRATPRGWDYGQGDGIPYGGMTTAGISSLTIALAHLENSPGKLDPQLRSKIEQAIADGFAWLSKHRAPRHVPGTDLHHAMNWWYYHLYGLERACELSNVGLIDGNDWYHDHAQLLLASQRKDGGWGRIEDTCWAILFLKKAQLPVYTRPR
jgi:hypothetical protein